jgi:hypothetical protein
MQCMNFVQFHMYLLNINFRVIFKVIKTIKLSDDWEWSNAKSKKKKKLETFNLHQQKWIWNQSYKLNSVKVIKRENKHNKNGKSYRTL